MRYENALVRIREKWPVKEICSNCVFVSLDLGEILQEEFPDSEIYTARSDNIGSGRRKIFFSNHQVSVIKENATEFVALDVTRPFYDEGKEFWMLRADSKDKLIETLKRAYTGDWRINYKYDPRTLDYIKITEAQEEGK